jgi:hypothetical protein
MKRKRENREQKKERKRQRGSDAEGLSQVANTFITTVYNIPSDEGINRLVGLCYPSQYSGKRENYIKSCMHE